MIFENAKGITIPEGVVTKIESNGSVLWEAEEKLKGNLVPSAIDTNGSVLNGVGYADGYRISSSGAIKEQSATVLTGFIDCTGMVDADIIRVKGATFNTDVYYTGIAFYDASFNILGSLSQSYASQSEATLYNNAVSTTLHTTGSYIRDGSNGITTIKVNFQEGGAGYARLKYFRLYCVGKGADMIVTVNEEIE